jgi:hypothetical protein
VLAGQRLAATSTEGQQSLGAPDGTVPLEQEISQSRDSLLLHCAVSGVHQTVQCTCGQKETRACQMELQRLLSPLGKSMNHKYKTQDQNKSKKIVKKSMKWTINQRSGEAPDTFGVHQTVYTESSTNWTLGCCSTGLSGVHQIVWPMVGNGSSNGRLW